ncbi:hypothetical protein BLNAU_9102 [Blattamonas nauphoetae]|uniref:Uncharacterized protein n=1 Tax=Blattamonas nauphoetae TaxID=2049346 RepID=A0ABQ9XWU0_9EUKA|nr:hypothetical protein BLNAU_9102 [Blattamonas nauphoetae]
MSFEDMSQIYNSLISLVKEEYPFDDVLQDRAVIFLRRLEPKCDRHFAKRLVTDLVPSPAGSPFGFFESILTLLSSPYSTVFAATVSFLNQIICDSSTEIHFCLMKSDIIPIIFATVHSHTLPILGNETMFNNLVWIIDRFLVLAYPSPLTNLGITAEVDAFNRREGILQKVVIPSSQFVTFLISNRYIIDGKLLRNFMSLLDTLFQIGPFHRPLLEFILASPIVIAELSILSFVETIGLFYGTIFHISQSLVEWKKHGHETAQSGKRIIKALFSEAFEDTLEQMMNNKDGYYERDIVDNCHSISQLLGSNVGRQ